MSKDLELALNKIKSKIIDEICKTINYKLPKIVEDEMNKLALDVALKNRDEYHIVIKKREDKSSPN